MPYRTPTTPVEYEALVKGSRFLALLTPLLDATQVTSWIAHARTTHPGASHYCSAWRFDDQHGFDDDGEPGGTAGRPMLEVLLKRDLQRVAVVCVRWFGGTKLGAGGLARAYGGTLAKTLDRTTITTVHATSLVTVRTPFPYVDTVHRLLQALPDATRGVPSYHEHGVDLPVTMRSDAVASLRTALQDATNAAAELHDDHERKEHAS